MTSYIYLLQEREFTKTKENIFKVGMTRKENYKRFNQYPKGSILLFQMICNDSKKVESHIINKFKEKFSQRTDIGNEYFEGDYTQMIDIIYFSIISDMSSLQQIKTTDKFIELSKDDLYSKKVNDTEYATRLILDLVDENHFNKDKPENMNFYISNQHDKIGRIYNGEYWEMKNSDDLAQEVFSLYRDEISKVMHDSNTKEEIEKNQKTIKVMEKWERANARKDFDDNVKQQLKEHMYMKKDLVINIHKLKGF